MSDFKRVGFEKFRQSLAFPYGECARTEEDDIKAFEFLVDLCAILPRFYGEELERTQLWERIGSGLSVAASRCQRSDELCDCMLSHVCASTSHAMANEDLKRLFKRQADINLSAVRHIIATRRLLVVCDARSAWNEERA